MLFNSIEFLIFLPTVFLLYWFVFQKNLNVHCPGEIRNTRGDHDQNDDDEGFG